MKKKWICVLLAALTCTPMAACKKSNEMKYMHVSLDDTIFAFENLATYGYDSIFEDEFFSSLKKLHEDYGAVISLYTYNSVLEPVSDAYAEEFQANASWLKLGLHANEHADRMSEETYENGLAYWNTFVGHVERVCGSTENLDRIPRLEFFSGSKDCVLGMKAAKNGALGFLTSSTAKAYYYGDTVAEYIQKNDYVRDEENGFVFLPTDLQLEETTDPYKDLTEIKEKSAFKERSASVIIYSHEYYVYDGAAIKDEFALLEGCCKFAKDNQIPFALPQDKEYAPSKGDSLFNE